MQNKLHRTNPEAIKPAALPVGDAAERQAEEGLENREAKTAEQTDLSICDVKVTLNRTDK
jgi:hypothetical protein